MSYDFSTSLAEFIALGAEIIRTKPATRYGWQYSNDRCLQPGFMPLTGPPKLVYVGINPSSNEPISTLESDLYQSWAKHPSLETYSAAYKAWSETNLQAWTVYSTVARIFERSNHSAERGDLGWLNIAKVPDSNSALITKEVASRDLPWLKKQLSMMGSEIFVVLGTDSSKYVQVRDYLLRQYGAHRVAVRGQRGQGDSLDSIHSRFATWLSTA